MNLYQDMLSQGAGDGRRLVRVERDGTRAVITLCDPERLNPLSAGLTVQLQARLTDLAADPSLRAVVITGQDPAFCAGGDLEMIQSGATAIQAAADPSDTTDAWRWIRRQFGGVVRTMTTTDKIFIGIVCLGALGLITDRLFRYLIVRFAHQYGPIE